MASLYEISEQMIECVDAETGEIIDEEKLDKLNMEWDAKIESMVLWYKNLLSDADQYKIEKNSFAEKEKAARNKAESLKNYIARSLAGAKFKTTRASVSYRKSESVEVDDINLLEDDYLRYSNPTPDKTKIKKSIKNGIEVKGARLVENNNIQIK